MFIEICKVYIYSIMYLYRDKVQFPMSQPLQWPFPLPCQGAKGSQVWQAQSLGKTNQRQPKKGTRIVPQNMVRDEFQLGK